MSDWGEENGCKGKCAACGRNTWIEFGCAPVCGGCEMPPDEEDEEDEDDEEDSEPKAVYVSESDRRFEYQELRGSFSNAD